MKFLLIGAGIGQLNLAKKIKERGHYLLVVAYNSIPEVIQYADKFIKQDLFLYDEVVDIAKAEKVEAVVSDQHDIMAPLVAYIAERLGLPGNKYETLVSYCNKNEFRSNCDKLGIPSPKHAKINNLQDFDDIEHLLFPLIVKPADSQSSLGVKKVHTVEECLKALEDAMAYSKTSEAIVEEFFTGQELVAEGFIWKGKYYNIAFGDRHYFNLPYLFIPSQTVFPSLVPEDVQSHIISYEERMAEYTNPNFAIVHSEYLYNPQTNQLRVVESGLRGGGVYISSHLIPLYSNIDINDMLLDASEGKELNVQSILQSKEEHASAYVCFYLPEGQIVRWGGYSEVISLNFVKLANLKEFQIGESSPALTHKGQRLGPFIIKDDNRALLRKDIEQIKQILHIYVRGHDGVVRDICWQ